jgi:hypothetical protein
VPFNWTWSDDMSLKRKFSALIGALGAVLLAASPGFAQQKPNILFIMGDDIGWMQPSIYHRGLMVGERPTSTASAKRARSS